MKKVLAIGGSSSKKSINRTLAMFTASKLENTEVTTIDLNDYELPIYSQDLEEKSGIPENAIKLNELIKSVDGFVVSLAEHNGSFASAYKNTTDWLSRIDVKVWNDKPMLLMASSPGTRGGMSVLETAKMLYPYAGAKIVADFSLPSFYDNFNDGISNEELSNTLNQKIKTMQEAL